MTSVPPQAMNRTVMSVAQMFGPALGGIFYELSGFYMPFVVFGVLHLVTLLPLVCVIPDSPGQWSPVHPNTFCSERHALYKWCHVQFGGSTVVASI